MAQASAPSTTTPFKSSLSLQTKVASRSGAAAKLTDADANEERYWIDKFGLGGKPTATKEFSHYRSVRLSAGSTTVRQLLFYPATVTAKSVPLAVVGGPRVQLYGLSANSTFHRLLSQHTAKRDRKVEVEKQVSTGGHVSYACSVRNDKQLMAVGVDNSVRVSDLKSRAVLRTYHTPLPVRCCMWMRNGQDFVAAGDDGMLRVYALKEAEPLLECKGHGDSVRAIALHQNPKHVSKAKLEDMVATGSYDHTVRLWKLDRLHDAKLQRCVHVLKHRAPVESLLWMTSKRSSVPLWLVSAGGTTVKVWNPLTGKCVSTVQTLHRKTITCLLAMPRKNIIDEKIDLQSRLLTGSLDGTVRIHSWDETNGTMIHLHGIHLPGTMVTSLTMTPNADRLAIGTATGAVLVRQRGMPPRSLKKEVPATGTYGFFTRGMNNNAVAFSDAIVASAPKKRKLKPYDIALKKFRYGEALDQALETTHPAIIVAVIEELGKRRGIRIALSGRNNDRVDPVMRFILKYLRDSRYSGVLIGLAHMLLDIYGESSDAKINEFVKKLRYVVATEYQAQTLLATLSGQLEMVLVAKSSRKRTSMSRYAKKRLL